jgi:hypothetical protein
MMSRLFIGAALLLLLASQARTQLLRQESMGGVSYALQDDEQRLGLYLFGGNPAAMLRDRTLDRLTIAPSTGAVWGDYRRKYTPERVNSYVVNFDGIKTLGEKGTFRGSTSYDVENRRGVYRSIKRTPYAGEAFFVTDTTSGNFTYNGPTVAFAYSYELLPHLLIGADVRYRVYDGLKSVYSMAKTLYREVGGAAGVVYEVEDNLAFGLTLRPSDVQERIEAKSDDLLDVEIFNFRGDTFATRRRSASVEHRVRRAGKEYGVQGVWHPLTGVEAALRADYGTSATRDIITAVYEKDVDAGYMQEEMYGGDIRIRWNASEALVFGATAGYRSLRQWSRNPAPDLLVWDSRFRETVFGGGLAVRTMEDGPLLVAEMDIVLRSADSAKFIDNTHRSLTANGIRVRAGVEQSMSEDLTIRGGYGYVYDGFDLVTGGEQVVSHTVTAGLQVRISTVTNLEWSALYGNSHPVTNLTGSFFSTVVLLKLLVF